MELAPHLLGQYLGLLRRYSPCMQPCLHLLVGMTLTHEPPGIIVEYLAVFFTQFHLRRVQKVKRKESIWILVMRIDWLDCLSITLLSLASQPDVLSYMKVSCCTNVTDRLRPCNSSSWKGAAYRQNQLLNRQQRSLTLFPGCLQDFLANNVVGSPSKAIYMRE